MIFLNPLEFVQAVGRLIKAVVTRKPLFVDYDVLCARMDTCSRDRASYEPKSGQCRICSCFICLKARLATEKCPSGLWKRALLKTRGLS